MHVSFDHGCLKMNVILAAAALAAALAATSMPIAAALSTSATGFAAISSSSYSLAGCGGFYGYDGRSAAVNAAFPTRLSCTMGLVGRSTTTNPCHGISNGLYAPAPPFSCLLAHSGRRRSSALRGSRGETFVQSATTANLDRSDAMEERSVEDKRSKEARCKEEEGGRRLKDSREKLKEGHQRSLLEARFLFEARAEEARLREEAATEARLGGEVARRLADTKASDEARFGEEEEAQHLSEEGRSEEEKEEELQAAIQEVQDAVQEVSQSATKLGKKVIDHGPSILTQFINRLISKDLRDDVARRREHYRSDWTDAFTKKRQTIPAILFLYFACLAPAVSFGTIASQITDGSIGVVEFLLSSGLSGMAYSILCGQPMAFIAPTGLTLAFISGLFRFCTLKGLPFFPVYAWVGIWTSFFMISLGARGASKLIRFCTRFTDEVFNGLLSINFIYEAASSLRRNFLLADPMNLSMPFVSLSVALGTFWSTMQVNAVQSSRYFNKKVRTLIKNFGPVSVIVLFSILNHHPWFQKFNVPTLGVPQTFQLAGGRKFLVSLTAVPIGVRLLCALPAVLLTSLFFMDQNISVRVVNNPENGLKKGGAYNLDMVALGLITGALSMVGLPWMCGATVQSMNHVRAMTETHFNNETQQLEIDDVTETRTTGFIIHALLALSIRLLPLLSFLPIPVVSGVFLFLGRKLMTGNSFFARIKDAFAETSRLPKSHPIHVLGRKKMNIFTAVQVLCLMGLWGFKQCTSISILFPSVIGMLMLIRSYFLPKFFSEEELVALGDPTPS